jgi:hypothetical protein
MENLILPFGNRWTLCSNSHEIEQCMLSVEVDLCNKLLKIKALEFKDQNITKWLVNLCSSEILKLSHFSGSGDLLCWQNFIGVKLISHKCINDYTISEPVTHHITMSYYRTELS